MQPREVLTLGVGAESDPRVRIKPSLTHLFHEHGLATSRGPYEEEGLGGLSVPLE